MVFTWPRFGLAVMALVGLSLGTWAAPEGSVSVSTCTPNTGPITGNTSVTIGGTGFVDGATVTFGEGSATGVAVVGATTILCTTPAHGAGRVDIVVTNPDSSQGFGPKLFTYQGPLPTLTGISPNSGSSAGGDSVTLTGTNFAGPAAVAFGGTLATGVTVVSGSSMTCTTPAHTAGSADVVLTNADGQTATLPSGFTYNAAAAPTVTMVTPNSGSSAGGTGVTVTGTGFANGATVKFGVSDATGVVFGSPTSLTCLSPAHAVGTVDVVVANPDGQSAALAQAYTYSQEACALDCAGTVPTTGAMGSAVSFHGAVQTSGSCTGTATYAWTFGDGQTSSDQNATHVYTLTGDYSWSMMVTQSGANCMQYGIISISPAVTPPTIFSVTKATNPLRLKVNGANFQPGSIVKIDAIAVPVTKYKSVTLLVAKGSTLNRFVPKGIEVNITVTNPDGGVSTPFKYTR